MSQVILPYLDFLGMLWVLAWVVTPRKSNSRGRIIADNVAEQRTRSYCAHPHLATNFILADRDIWPADLARLGLDHSSVIAKLDPGILASS